MTEPPDDRAPFAIAASWAARIITVSLEMVLPGALGYWLDNWIGSKFVFMLLGFGAGLTFGTWHLMRMTRTENEQNDRQSK